MVIKKSICALIARLFHCMSLTNVSCCFTNYESCFRQESYFLVKFTFSPACHSVLLLILWPFVLTSFGCFRDLAARNILVASEELVKISDFGLDRSMADDKVSFLSGATVFVIMTFVIKKLVIKKQ